MGKVRKSSALSALCCATALASASGCIPIGDPEGPGASGTVSLGKGQSAEDYTVLRARAVPAPRNFDPEHPFFPKEGGADSGFYLSADDAYDDSYSGEDDGVVLPQDYRYAETLGTTPHRRWRIFIWLGKSEDEARPSRGAPYGTTEFKLDDCGAYDDYCGVTGGVDVVLDRTAP